MPELPEVETVRRGLEPVLVGARLTAVEARRPDLRAPLPPHFARRLTGRRVESLGRRAKYLLADLDDGMVLVMHLGMSGSFRVEHGTAATTPGRFHHPHGQPGAHDHIVFRTDGGATVTYNDPRRFGLMTLVPRRDLADHPLFQALGIEPLGNALDGAALAAAFAGKATSLKAALMDQRLIAGLGNIYVCEALHRARLSPLRTAGTLATPSGGATVRGRRLAEAIRAVLDEAIIAGGSSLRDHRRTDGELGAFQHSFRVYGREGAPCVTPRCRGIVRRIVQNGRSTFYCPVCQR
jgi:formamidopyrimidine-DNA glycosylase